MTALCRRVEGGNNERQNRYRIFDGSPGGRHFVHRLSLGPVSEELGAENPNMVECIERSGVSKDRDYRVAGYKVTKCAEQSGAAPP